MGSGFTPLVFTGVSKYSSDFQTILTRAVNIASLPVKQLQNQEADILGKKQLLTDLSTAIQGLGTSLTALGGIGDTKALSATTSNASRVSVSLNGAAQASNYSITNITSVARAASETSAAGTATADSTQVSGLGSVELAVGSKTYTINLAADKNNLNGLRDAINSLGAGVTASVLNTGSGAAPFYLSLSANATGAKALQIRTTPGDGSTNILTASNAGANSEFDLNGIHVSKADNVVSGVIPGVTFSILSQTGAGETVTLGLSSDRGQLACELSNFADRYNAVAKAVNAQIGKNAGLLTGDISVRETQAKLRAISAFEGLNGGSTVKRLADLGIEFDSSGKAVFNSSKFYSLSNADLANAFDYINSSASGLGSLAAKTNELTNPVTGLIKTQQNQIDATDERIQKQLTILQDRISALQTATSKRLQQADALLASLDTQQSILTSSIDSANLALYGKRN